MVKQNPPTNSNRNINRTSYRGPTNPIQSYPSRNNRVEVAQSKGCCGSRKVASVPPRPVMVQHSPRPQQHQTKQETAHERTHHRLDPPDPFYTRYGRIKKNPHRARKTYQPQYTGQQMNSNRSNYEPQQTSRSRNYQQQPPSARQYQPQPTARSYQQQQQPIRAPPTAPPKKSSCCTIL